MRKKILSVILVVSLLFLVAVQVYAQELIEVKIKSNPSGATVYLDDKFIGRTPLTTQIAEGEHNIKLDYGPGYITFDKDIYITTKNTSFYFRLGSTFGKKVERALGWALLVMVILWVAQGAP